MCGNTTALQGNLAAFGAVVDQIYQCALEPTAWPRTLVAIADWLESKNAVLYTPLEPKESDRFVLFSHGFSAQSTEIWRGKHTELDVWTHVAAQRQLIAEGVSVLGTELVPLEELKRTRWYDEYLRVDDIPELMAGVIFDGQTPNTLATVCSMFRGEQQPPFDADDLARFRLLLPHISRALGVMYRLRQADLQVANSLASLERLATGVLLVAQPATVVFANRAAQRMLRAEDGLRVRGLPHGGHRLEAETPAQHEALDAALRQIMLDGDLLHATHFGKALRVDRPSGLAPYVLRLSALPGHNEFGRDGTMPRAIVFLNDSAESPRIEPELLMELYRLSPAEARLAVTLSEGDELAEAAQRHGISPNTAKSQLQSIYAKTGTDNRARLTKLLLALASSTVTGG